MAKIANLQEVAVNELKPYERNAKIHGKAQIEKLKASIEAFGFLTPCLIDREKNLIAGHGRIMAAKELGIQKVPCVLVEDLTEEERRAYILADNRLSELGEWDMNIVQGEIDDLKAAGFDVELTGFGIDFSSFDIDEPDEEQLRPETATEPRTKRGDIWTLGEHKLMVGDATSSKDVAALMNGEKADLLLTDPPYGVEYESWQGMTIQADDLQGDALEKFLAAAFGNADDNMHPGAGFYIWHASQTIMQFLQALAETNLTTHQQLVWVKNTGGLSRSDYQWRHEPCLYGWKEGAAHYFIDLRTLTTVEDKALEDLSKDELIALVHELHSITTALPEKKPTRSDEHPTMKPVPLFEKQIRNSTKEGDLVLDLFGGSGTTLLAAEKMNRRCRIMEIDPGYADVILNRWEEMTGRTAVLDCHV